MYVHHLSHVLCKSVPFHLLQLFAALHRARLVAEGLLFDNVRLTGGIVRVIGGVGQGIGERFEVGNQFLRRATLLCRLGAFGDLGHEIRMLDLPLVSLAGPEVVPKRGRLDWTSPPGFCLHDLIWWKYWEENIATRKNRRVE